MKLTTQKLTAPYLRLVLPERIGSEHQLRQARLEAATLSVLLDAKKKVA